MSKDNRDFFKKKLLWSQVKDELLISYLPQYFSKVLLTRRPVFYVDCFAGKGRFDDGGDGSPRIALRIRREALSRTTARDPRINMTFIDVNYAEDLQRNTLDYPDHDQFGVKEIVSGRYEENIIRLLRGHQFDNVFMYVDPYGIKALDFDLFQKIANEHRGQFELLINMNSFGFLRDACRVMDIGCDEIDTEDIVEYSPSEFDRSQGSRDALNAIAGGDYWQPIVLEYKERRLRDPINAGYYAEEQFSRAYKKRLNGIFPYVLDMPIRLKDGNRPKYRMVHATYHPDGCNLMAANMIARTKELVVDVQHQNQMDLFDFAVDHQYVDTDRVKAACIDQLKAVGYGLEFNKFVAEFFNRNGVICSQKDIVDVLRELERVKKIEVVRNPPFTEKTHRPSSFFETGKGKSTVVKGLCL